MKQSIPAVIFAGGKSSRMGRDKALLPFSGYPTLAHYQHERLLRYFEKVYISTKEEKFDFEAKLIHDRYEVSSPLAGIVSIFETLKNDAVFILSVDAPFVDKTVIDRLIEESEDGYDAIVAQTPGGLQPLCGIYRRSILPLAKQSLEMNRHRLTGLLKEAKSKAVRFEEEGEFLNLNHPHEYEEALKQL